MPRPPRDLMLAQKLVEQVIAGADPVRMVAYLHAELRPGDSVTYRPEGMPRRTAEVRALFKVRSPGDDTEAVEVPGVAWRQILAGSGRYYIELRDGSWVWDSEILSAA